ncbi:hypothetical protein HZU67_02626 [Apis mellifera carnica]|uniref:Uncharacterized protein n=1 Tax=Apis mellifera TaxID=7460 RepID=A0A7M7R2M2_APIME|nr:putative uncharacterized protein DDB_G0277255 [Apis mellifera]XP_006564428.1 putative uncharacterized protein DDB_G0277255 [Apis mellifera]XP_391899.4 putative uncharacterized protein DDB_G0277255 [Apis mellifera]KAG9436202.1 hypothetical protein HZU67_02626 [Apis mellifera carnica]|eukprot:XP_006564427.1 putative uncharacterized protein DDB_G0277255 [Apis mellifera]
MSASALKSTIPGVGTSPSSTSHSILPMNAMAQKVVSGSEPASMKPLPGTGLSYVTLQPPNHPSSQPLSLVQDHRPSVYQTPPYVSSNSEKEDLDKLIPNGVEIMKTETEQNISVSIKQNESNRNNNLSPDNPTQDSQREVQTDQEMTSINLDFPALCPQLQNKVEEKKTPVNNGSKESDGIPINTTSQTKLSSHKSEDGSVKSDSQKSKTITQNTKLIADSSALSQASNPPKIETKVTGSPKANKRKSRELKDLKGMSATSDGASKPKRNRIQTQPYQSPLPEIALLVKNLNKPPPSKASDDKLIVFYKNEFLAVRNAEGSFYVCQAMQNIYKSSRKIRIRWLSQDKNNGEIYSPDFYDYIDFDCILTNLNLNKIDKNKFQLTKIELLRTENILKRAIDVEAGVSEKPRVTEEHPDGLDLSLYKDESQLKRRKSHNLHKQKQSLRKKAKRTESFSEDDAPEDESGKKSPKSNRSKKRTVNKALAIAKSVAKGSSRAERALNRNTKSGSEITAATNSTTTTTVTTSTTSIDVTKNNTDIKRSENKKSTKQQNNNNTSGVSRTKLRASAQNTQQSNKTAGRPKRMAAATGIVSTEETIRKKPRGRA